MGPGTGWVPHFAPTTAHCLRAWLWSPAPISGNIPEGSLHRVWERGCIHCPAGVDLGHPVPTCCHLEPQPLGSCEASETSCPRQQSSGRVVSCSFQANAANIGLSQSPQGPSNGESGGAEASLKLDPRGLHRVMRVRGMERTGGQDAAGPEAPSTDCPCCLRGRRQGAGAGGAGK